ncbi:hypothetical protein [Nocardioides ginsengisegetis]|uniref:hypothetical protein n=1 Tax=Nocardioides ginsengisegetis TaxID=661491 RepID=UPI0015FC09F7|nr:hypothetical protein [Nocardioides ginsengisegetis]
MPDVFLLLLTLTLVAAGLAWLRRAVVVALPLTLLGLAVTAYLAAANVTDPVLNEGERALIVAVSALLAIAGGGPVTTRVFALVDGPRHTQDDGSVSRAGEVLRGGTWIGALERAAVFASLAAGIPEGVAIVLGLKGLGRYPELRSGEVAGAAERFIIGTFTSVLWAAACAGTVRLVLWL